LGLYGKREIRDQKRVMGARARSAGGKKERKGKVWGFNKNAKGKVHPKKKRRGSRAVVKITCSSV